MKRLCIILILLPLPAFAGTPDFLQQYYTWGSFNLVCTTFERIALMMSDSRYFIMIFCIAVLGLVFGQFHAYLKMFKRGAGQMTLMYGAVLFFTGIVIYMATIVPKTTMHVYDKSYNQYKPVGNLPVLLVWTAGFTNWFERTFIDIIETSSDPLSYQNSAGGNVLSLVRNFFDSDTDLSSSSKNGFPDRLFQLSLRKYLYDCVTFEMGRPGSKIDVNDFFSTSDFKKTIAKANSMSVRTKYYDEDFLSGRDCSCYSAWTKLDAGFNTLDSSAVRDHTTKVLYKSGIVDSGNTDNRNLLQVADQKITAFFNATVMKDHEPTRTGQIFTQWLIASELFNAVQDGKGKRISSRKTGTAMTGAGLMAAEWVPVMRSVMFAVYMCLFPFLTLLIVTPMAGRALKFMLGTLVFFSAWSICDVIIHSVAMQQAGYLFEGLKNQQLGLNNLLMFSDQASKGLAILGGFKFSSMALAGVLTGLVISKGSGIAGTMASNIAMAEQHGAASASMVHNPGQRAAAYRDVTRAAGTDHLAGLGGQYGITQTDSFRQESEYAKDALMKAALENTDDRGWKRSHLEAMGGVTSWNKMSAAQKNAYGQVSSAIKGIGSQRALESKKEDVFESLEESYRKGDTSGEQEKIGLDAYDKYSDQMTQAQRIDSESMNYLRTNAPNIALKAANDFLEDNKLSYRTGNQLKNFSRTEDGRAMLQNAFHNVRLAAVSQNQAATINKMAVESGLVREGQNFIEAGQSVTMDLGYDPKTGELSCSNLSAQKMMNVGEGTQINRTTGISEKEVTEGGATETQKTLDDDVVHKSTRKGEEISSRNIRVDENVTPEKGHTIKYSDPVTNKVGFTESREGDRQNHHVDDTTIHVGPKTNQDALVQTTYEANKLMNKDKSEKDLLIETSHELSHAEALGNMATPSGAIKAGATVVKNIVDAGENAVDWADEKISDLVNTKKENNDDVQNVVIIKKISR